MDTKQVHGESTCRANECIPRKIFFTTQPNWIKFGDVFKGSTLEIVHSNQTFHVRTGKGAKIECHYPIDDKRKSEILDKSI